MFRLAQTAALLASFAATGALAQELRIGADMDYPPYIMTEPDGSLSGFDKDLMDLICAAGGYDCIWVPLEIGVTFTTVAGGGVDLAIGGIGVTPERRQIIDYTCIYDLADGGSGTFYGLTTGIDRETASVSVNAATVHAAALDDMQLNAVPFPSNEAALRALLEGQTKLFFGTQTYIDRALGAQADALIPYGSIETETAGAAIVVAQNNPALRSDLNAILAQLSANGTIGELQARWFGYNQGDVIAQCQGPVLNS